jgi:hypothetical protein
MLTAPQIETKHLHLLAGTCSASRLGDGVEGHSAKRNYLAGEIHICSHYVSNLGNWKSKTGVPPFLPI